MDGWIRWALTTALVLVLAPVTAAAQDSQWRADLTVGWAGVVDDATDNYLVLGSSLRRYVTPRLSIGPEVVVMSNSSLSRDRMVLVTGNAVFDLVSSRVGRVVPFLVGGVGIVKMREQVRNGPFWSSDPSFTAGGGVRAKISESLWTGAEYRIGWELHQRVAGLMMFGW